MFFFTQTAVPYTFASPELNTKFRPPQRQHTAIISSEELAAAQGLETLLFEQAIQEMRKTVPENDLMPLSQSERIFRQMLDSEYAKLLSKNQALGIAELIIAQLYNKR